MRLEPSEIAGVRVLQGTEHVDTRGVVRKMASTDTCRAAGLTLSVDQVLTTENLERATVRGLHLQIAPCEETKVLWVSRGAIFDVLVDTRRAEPTFGSWAAVELSGDESIALHVPPGVAHGYQTLEDGSSLTYLIAGEFSPDHARTIRWDDPALAIDWPLAPGRMSDADRAGSSWPIT